MRLVQLLKRHEGKTLEFKRDLSSSESVLKCLVAFANTGGGIVVIGIEDGSKNVRGVPDVLAAEEKLANLVSDSIRPHLVPDIEVVPWRNLNVLAVQAYPSNTRPHYPERLGPQDGVFIRCGLNQSKGGRAADRRTETPKLDELFRRAGHPGPQVGSHRLPSCFGVVCAYRQMTAQAWTTLRIVTEHQGRQVPTIGGLLLFGKDRFARFPDAWIQAGRFAGTNRTRLLDSAEIRSLADRTVRSDAALRQPRVFHPDEGAHCAPWSILTFSNFD